MSELLSFAFSILTLVGGWRVFQKMGKPGWAIIVPFYNMYTMFDAIYGNGWKFLLLLIPFYNIYVAIKLYIDLAHEFGQSTGFGIGLVFLSPIFMMILGFGNYSFRNGTVAETTDFVSDAVNKVTNEINDKVNN